MDWQFSVSPPGRKHGAYSLFVLRLTLGRQSASTQARTTCTVGPSAPAPTSYSPTLTEQLQIMPGKWMQGPSPLNAQQTLCNITRHTQQDMGIASWPRRPAIPQALWHFSLCLLVI